MSPLYTLWWNADINTSTPCNRCVSYSGNREPHAHPTSPDNAETGKPGKSGKPGNPGVQASNEAANWPRARIGGATEKPWKRRNCGYGDAGSNAESTHCAQPPPPWDHHPRGDRIVRSSRGDRRLRSRNRPIERRRHRNRTNRKAEAILRSKTETKPRQTSASVSPPIGAFHYWAFHCWGSFVEWSDRVLILLWNRRFVCFPPPFSPFSPFSPVSPFPLSWEREACWARARPGCQSRAAIPP